jgi:hypothetical protein
MLNLANLILKDTVHRVGILQGKYKPIEPNPEIYIVTRIEWRSHDTAEPIIPQLPRLLSFLETLRGTDSVPSEIHLDSTEGFSAYLPTGIRVSQLPDNDKECIRRLIELTEEKVTEIYSIADTVHTFFWKRAQNRNYGPDIIRNLASGKYPERHTQTHLEWFREIMNEYFSIHFKIEENDTIVRVEV